MLLKSAHAIIAPKAKIATMRTGKGDHLVTYDSKSGFGVLHTRKPQSEKVTESIIKINYGKIDLKNRHFVYLQKFEDCKTTLERLAIANNDFKKLIAERGYDDIIRSNFKVYQ